MKRSKAEKKYAECERKANAEKRTRMPHAKKKGEKTALCLKKQAAPAYPVGGEQRSKFESPLSEGQASHGTVVRPKYRVVSAMIVSPPHSIYSAGRPGSSDVLSAASVGVEGSAASPVSVDGAPSVRPWFQSFPQQNKEEEEEEEEEVSDRGFKVDSVN